MSKNFNTLKKANEYSANENKWAADFKAETVKKNVIILQLSDAKTTEHETIVATRYPADAKTTEHETIVATRYPADAKTTEHKTIVATRYPADAKTTEHETIANCNL